MMKMSCVLAAVLAVLGVGLSPARADMYIVDKPMAQQFLQQNTPVGSVNELYLVIDYPGTVGSNIDWQKLVQWDNYGATMQGDVGFVGQLLNGEVIRIGYAVDGQHPLPLGGPYDGFGIQLANDDDDDWAVRPYVTGITYTDPGFTTLAPGTSAFVSLSGLTGTPTGFGFDVMISGDRGSDNFHISAVPLPGAILMGLLGLTAAGAKLRRFA